MELNYIQLYFDFGKVVCNCTTQYYLPLEMPMKLQDIVNIYEVILYPRFKNE